MTGLKGGTPRAATLVAKIGNERYNVARPEDAAQAGGRSWVVEHVPVQEAEGDREFMVSLRDWSNGSGYTFEGPPGTYDSGDGWDCSAPGKPTTWPQRAAGAGIETADFRGWQAQHGGYLYVMRGRYCAKYAIDDTKGAVWPIIELHDFGAGKVVAGRPARFKGALYVPLRDGAGGTLARFHELTSAATTEAEVQTIVISGTPTGGSYTITFDGKTTGALAHDAGQAAVQAALRAVPGLQQVTVSTAGSSPDFTHTVTLTGVAGAMGASSPPQMTSTSSLTGGSDPQIAHATTDAGTTDTWTLGPENREARCFRVWQNKLVLANANYVRTVSDDPMTEGDWAPTTSVGYEVGDSGREITDLATYGKLLVVAKTDGLWTFDESLNTENQLPDLEGVVDDNNGIGIEAAGGYLLVPHKSGLIRWAPGEFAFVGAQQEGALEGDRTRGWGRVTGIAPYGRQTYYTANDALNVRGAVMSLLPPTEARRPLVPHMHHEHEDASLDGAIVVQATNEPAHAHLAADSEDDSGVGTTAWTGTGAGAGSLVPAGAPSHYLKTTDYGFNIPPEATVQGVKVDITRHVEPVTPSLRATPVNAFSASGDSIQLTKPSGTVDGDFLIAVISWLSNNEDGIYTTTLSAVPSGWIVAAQFADPPANVGEPGIITGVFIKTASGEGANWTWTLNQPGAYLASVAAYKDIDITQPYSQLTPGILTAGASDRWDAPYGPVSRDNSLAVSWFAQRWPNTEIAKGLGSVPAGMGQRLLISLGAPPWALTLALADMNVDAGASGTLGWQGQAAADGLNAAVVTFILNGKQSVTDAVVKLVKGGAVTGDNRAMGGAAWPVASAPASYGGSLDMWGATLTPADVNAADFGAAIAVQATSGALANVLAIAITVYYFLPGSADPASFLSVLHIDASREAAHPVIYTLPRAGLPVGNDPNIDQARDNAVLRSSRLFAPSRDVQKTWRVVELWLDAEPETNTPGLQIWASVDDGEPFQLLDAPGGGPATFRTTGFHLAYFPLTAASVGRYVQIIPAVPAAVDGEVDVAVSFRDMALRGTYDPILTPVFSATLVLGGGEYDDLTSDRRTRHVEDLTALAQPVSAPVPYSDPWGKTGWLKVTRVQFREIVFRGQEKSAFVALVEMRKTA